MLVRPPESKTTAVRVRRITTYPPGTDSKTAMLCWMSYPRARRCNSAQYRLVPPCPGLPPVSNASSTTATSSPPRKVVCEGKSEAVSARDRSARMQAYGRIGRPALNRC